MSANEKITQELDALLTEAMKQPGVAEAMAVYSQTWSAFSSAEQANQSLKAHWVYHSSTSST